MRLCNIVENIQTRMGLFTKIINDINNKVNKNTEGKLKSSPQFSKLIRLNNLQSIEDLVRYINQFDPTGDKATYTQWIINIVASGQLNIPEDGERILKTLSIFNSVKISKALQINKDINSYKNFRELETMMQKYSNTNIPNTLRQWNEWIKSRGYTKVYGDSIYTILKFAMTGETIEAGPHSIGKYESNWVPASMLKDGTSTKSYDIAALSLATLACGTSYCVAHPDTATNYLKIGPLFAVFKNGQFMLLSAYDWNEFRGTHDISLATMSPHLAVFMSKAILNAASELGDIETLQNMIAHTMKTKTINNAKALQLMDAAVKLRTNN